MNNLTLFPCCEERIGRADIEESKSNVDMNSWLPQASSCVPFSIRAFPRKSPMNMLIPNAKLVRFTFKVVNITVSSGSSTYLRLCFTTKPIPLRALNCSVWIKWFTLPKSAADHPISRIISRTRIKCTPIQSVTTEFWHLELSGLSSIQVCRLWMTFG